MGFIFPQLDNSAIASNEGKESITASSDGQTSFQISEIASSQSDISVFWRGWKFPDSAYAIAGQSLDISASGKQILTGEIIEIVY